MKRVVVDASVLIAALMADGRARHVLLQADAAFFVPPLILEEVDRNRQRIEERSGLQAGTVRMVLDRILDRVDEGPDEALEPHMEEARQLADEAEAYGDEDYVALALAWEAPVWTYDHDFHRIRGVEAIHTSGLDPGGG